MTHRTPKLKFKGTMTQRLDRIERAVGELKYNQNTLFEGEEIIMTQLSDALDQIEQNAEADRNADAAAKALILKLGQMIKDGASGAPTAENFAKLKAIGQGMVDRAADLSAAVVAGTPAEAPGDGGQSAGGIPRTE